MRRVAMSLSPGLALAAVLLATAACNGGSDEPQAGVTGIHSSSTSSPLSYTWGALADASRTFALDGVLSEWSDADRLDAKPGMEVAGHALFGYHDALNGKYHVAIYASGGIGPSTTFWLNTDRDTATGYRVWGSEVGAEFNINVAGDGAPHLYTGADGQTWLAGPISHAYNADKTVLELEFTHAMVSASAPIEMWVDVNSATYLPGWYGLGGYVIDAEGVPAPPAVPQGDIALDGDLHDWTPADRLDRLPGLDVLGYEIFGRADATHYYFALRALPPAVGFGPGTTLWLNIDRNRATGHQVWGIAVGAEYNINIAADGTPHLYTGAAAQNWQIGPLAHGRSVDGNTLEIAVSRDRFDGYVASLDVSIDVNDTVFLPSDFTGPGYTLYHPDDLPAAAADRQVRIALVYSSTSEAQYFGSKAYSQLYAAMQHQAMQAGIPFTLLHQDALTDIQQIKDFDVLFIPYMSSVPAAMLPAIEDTLTKAIYHYGIGIITAGNFLTNEAGGAPLPGDSYVRMKRLLGVTLEAGIGPADFSVHAGGDHPVLRGYHSGELLVNYSAGYVQQYARYRSVAHSLATVVTADRSYDGVWAVSSASRSVHFANTALMGDTDLAWRALLWSIYGDGPWVGLQLTRHNSLLIARCDMDQSQYADEAPTVYGAMVPIVEKWKNDFDFVSSYYVNVGNNKAQYEFTDWKYSAPVYQKLISLGGEIGTHSYTHPEYTSLLSQSELEFEFKTSRDVIAAHIGVPVVGAAVPGNPETLAVDLELDKYFAYATADYSGFTAGYHGAMGHLTPDFNMIYLAPNMYFDFTLIGFWQVSAEAALGIWKRQFDELVARAPSAVVVWPWHDYGPSGYEGPQYTEAMYTDFLAHAWAAGTEFVTAAEAARRIEGYTSHTMSVHHLDSQTLRIEVLGDADTGRESLRIEPVGDLRVVSVDGWPAFEGDRVLLGEGERTYTVRLGTQPAAIARLRKLPMRASLKLVQAEDRGLKFSFEGAGRAEVALPAGVVSYKVDCGDAKAFAGNVLSLDFASGGLHTCQIEYAL